MRSIVSRAAAALFLIAAAGAAHGAVVFGDLNGDGKVNVVDATLALQISVGLVHPTADQLIAGDVSPLSPTGAFGDGKITVADATRILRRAVGSEAGSDWPGTVSFDLPAPSQGVALPTAFTLSVAGDVAHDITLPGGFKLQGQASGGVRTMGETILIIDPTTFTEASDQLSDTGGYLVGVPAGNYQLVYSADVTSQATPPGGMGTPGVPTCIPNVPGIPDVPGIPKCPDAGMGSTTGRLDRGGSVPLQFPGMGTTTSLEIPLGQTVQVNSDTTRDFTRPALPKLFTVHGKVTTTPAVMPPFQVEISPAPDPASKNPFAAIRASTSVTSLDGTYSASLPAGTYVARISVFDLASGNSLDADAQQQIQVSGDTTQDLTAVFPTKFALSGPVTTAGGGMPANDTVNVSASQQVANPMSPLFFGGDSGFSTVTAGQYSMQIPNGNYTLSVELPDSSGMAGQWRFAVGSVTVQGNTTRAIVVPALPAGKATVHGKVLGPDGKPIVKGALSFNSTHIAAGPDGLAFSTYAQIQADGSYSVSVPAGDYRVTVVPTLDFPVAFPSSAGSIPSGGI